LGLGEEKNDDCTLGTLRFEGNWGVGVRGVLWLRKGVGGKGPKGWAGGGEQDVREGGETVTGIMRICAGGIRDPGPPLGLKHQSRGIGRGGGVGGREAKTVFGAGRIDGDTNVRLLNFLCRRKRKERRGGWGRSVEQGKGKKGGMVFVFGDGMGRGGAAPKGMNLGGVKDRRGWSGSHEAQRRTWGEKKTSAARNDFYLTLNTGGRAWGSLLRGNGETGNLGGMVRALGRSTGGEGREKTCIGKFRASGGLGD